MSAIFARTMMFLAYLFCSPIQAAELKIVFGQYTPPYVFEDGSGILVEIVRTALAQRGYQVKPIYVPIGRGLKMFAEGEVDGTTIIQESSGLKAEYSDVLMHYHNRAFALKAAGVSISALADLSNKSVTAFQNARKYLGEEFARAVAGNRRYKEMARQKAQAQMLLLGRIEVAVMDEAIFRYYRQELIAEGKVGPEQAYVSFDIFPPTSYKAAFIDPAVRDDFNAGIAAMRSDGRYQAIYRKYTKDYFSSKE